MSLSLDRINISHKGEDDIQSIDNNFQAIENEINSHLADYANLLSSFNGLFNNVPNIQNSNLDNFPVGFAYSGGNNTNEPAARSIVLTVVRSASVAMQIAVNTQSGRVYTRGKSAGTWTAWQLALIA